VETTGVERHRGVVILDQQAVDCVLENPTARDNWKLNNIDIPAG